MEQSWDLKTSSLYIIEKTQFFEFYFPRPDWSIVRMEQSWDISTTTVLRKKEQNFEFYFLMPDWSSPGFNPVYNHHRPF